MLYKYLDKVNSPYIIKKMSEKQLRILSAEIRDFLTKNIAETGGHLASNLGVVELTLAIHRSFDSPKDKIIWDVGHQSYVHKIITGRKARFDTLRKKDGISGFPKYSESEHDVFDTGHSSTAISAALGFCYARDLKRDDVNEKVVAVLGDGALTGGLAYEALNNAGRMDTDIVVVLNDNDMSISNNVGAMSAYLSKIRTTPSYLGVKQDVHSILDMLPLGDSVTSIIESVKGKAKRILIKDNFFQDLGFNYIGPVDGHNIAQLIQVFSSVKKMKGPILVHVYTKKGKGYSPAETQPECFHGTEGFDILTGKQKKTDDKSYSEVFGDTMCELAVKNKKLIAVTAAMKYGSGLAQFARRYPKRIIDTGIAEAHAVTFAAGLSANGYTPVVAVYSSFMQRCYDQILHDVCINNRHVIFAIDRAGFVSGDGETHQGVFDISFLSHMPNMVIMAPSTGAELSEMLKAAVLMDNPVAIRYPKQTVCDEIYTPLPNFADSESVILSVGSAYGTCHKVTEKLISSGNSIDLINVRYVKPISDIVREALGKYKNIFVVEEGQIYGGFGSLLLIEANRMGLTPNIKLFGVNDGFPGLGTTDELREMFGLDVDTLYTTISGIING
jgi:1-deoxy-D-xylulose-5-phosphate synthase